MAVKAIFEAIFLSIDVRSESLLSAIQFPIHLTPVTHETPVAMDWFGRFKEAGLDRVMVTLATALINPRRMM
jgi:hypothetical protein